MPAVSVVVLTWERRELLALALDSILAQSMGDLEVLVVDNESEDGTTEMVGALSARDRRVRYLRHANGGNLSVNRNHGIAHATGEWVAFCDDDDLWLPTKLERQLGAATGNPRAGMVCSNAAYFSVDGQDRESVYGTLVDRPHDGWVEFSDLVSSRRTQVVLSSALVRRDVMEAVGPWDTDPGLFAVEDLQYWIRLASMGHRILYLAEPLVRFRVHASAASSADTRVTARKQLYMVDRLCEEGVLDGDRCLEARSGFRRKARRATLKELLKRVPGLRRAVYLYRKTRSGDGGW